MNGVPYNEQPVHKTLLPVLFETREIAPAVWVPVASMGSEVRKGKNTIRIEFQPADPNAAYDAQLRWATVTDQVREERGPDTYKGTNQADEGAETKHAKGRVELERTFTADFARDVAWHHPPITGLTEEDRQALAKLVSERPAWFAPPYDRMYKVLEGNEHVKVAGVRSSKCLDAARAAGVHVGAPPADQLQFLTPGGPEVVVQRKDGRNLYTLDPGAIEKIKGEEKQLCAGVALSLVYPPRLVCVHRPDGKWEAVS